MRLVTAHLPRQKHGATVRCQFVRCGSEFQESFISHAKRLTGLTRCTESLLRTVSTYYYSVRISSFFGAFENIQERLLHAIRGVTLAKRECMRSASRCEEPAGRRAEYDSTRAYSARRSSLCTATCSRGLYAGKHRYLRHFAVGFPKCALRTTCAGRRARSSCPYVRRAAIRMANAHPRHQVRTATRARRGRPGPG